MFFSRVKMIRPNTKPKTLTSRPPISSVRPPMPPRNCGLVQVRQNQVRLAAAALLLGQQRRCERGHKDQRG